MRVAPTLTSGDASVTLDRRAGGRLSSLIVSGHELLIDEASDDPIRWGSFPMIPWAGRVRHGRFTLDGDEVRLPLGLPPHAIHGTRTMSVSAGWHPWFRRSIGGATVTIDLPAQRMWRRDREGIPDGTLIDPPPGPWDDCFTGLTGPVVLRWPGVLRLEIASTCAHVVIYDESDDGVCVEPQSAPPDAHNSGCDLAEIGPRDSWTIATTWTWVVEEPAKS